MRNQIHTDRLILRRTRTEDAKVMTQRINHPEILLMTASLPMPFFSLAAEYWLIRAAANWRRGRAFAYAITQKGAGHDDSMMGVVDLFMNSENDWEIGYWIGKDFWGAGFMSEAAKGLLSEAFRTFDMPYIDAGYFEDNLASGRVLEKLGFISKNEPSYLFSVARGERFSGIELRLSRNMAARWQLL